MNEHVMYTLNEHVMYARMWGGKRLHIVTGPHEQAFVAACGSRPGVRRNGYATPGWYSGQMDLSVYYPLCKACERASGGGAS